MIWRFPFFLFGIPVSLYFINSLLTITIFPNIVIIITVQRKWKGEEHVTIIFTVFLFVVCSSRQMPCCPGLLWEVSHVKRLEELLTRQILVPSYGIFLSRLSRRLFSSSALSYRAFSDKRYLHQSVLKNWWQGRFFFWLTAHSSSDLRHILVQAVQPFSSNALSSGAIESLFWKIEPSPASVLVLSFGIFSSKLLTFRKTARWCCMLFPLTDFCYRSKICPGDEPGKQMASTEDLLKRKINWSWWELNPDRPVANPTFYL